nr:O-antigen ligase family protein [Thiolinea disciformis]
MYFTALLASRGRAGWISFLLTSIMFLLIIFFRYKSKIGRFLLILAAFISAFLFLNTLSNNTITKRASSIITFISVNKNSTQGGFYAKYKNHLSSRMGIWINSLEISAENILIGSGPDTFALFYHDHLPDDRRSKVLVDKPHNIYIQNLLNIGGLGLVSFLGIMIIFFYRAYHFLLEERLEANQNSVLLALTLGVLGYLLAGMFYDSTVHVSPIFWVVLGLGAAMTRPRLI